MLRALLASMLSVVAVVAASFNSKRWPSLSPSVTSRNEGWAGLMTPVRLTRPAEVATLMVLPLMLSTTPLNKFFLRKAWRTFHTGGGTRAWSSRTLRVVPLFDCASVTLRRTNP